MTWSSLLLILVVPMKAGAWLTMGLASLLLDLPAGYLGGLTGKGGPIAEPLHIVSGLRYSSLKCDLPWTDDSCWFYTGDEPTSSGGVDENTFTYRISDFADTFNLDGHETKP